MDIVIYHVCYSCQSIHAKMLTAITFTLAQCLTHDGQTGRLRERSRFDVNRRGLNGGLVNDRTVNRLDSAWAVFISHSDAAIDI